MHQKSKRKHSANHRRLLCVCMTITSRWFAVIVLRVLRGEVGLHCKSRKQNKIVKCDDLHHLFATFPYKIIQIRFRWQLLNNDPLSTKWRTFLSFLNAVSLCKFSKRNNTWEIKRKIHHLVMRTGRHIAVAILDWKGILRLNWFRRPLMLLIK